MQEPSFDELLAQLRCGDEAAAAQIFQHFGQRLIALASSRLDGLVRRKVDPEDVMQSVFRSFFRREADGQFDLADWDSLWSLLTLLTLRRCRYHVRQLRAARRDIRREIAPPPLDEESQASWQAIAREPTAEEAVLLAETVEQLFRGLDEPERRIVELSLQGYKAPEISRQVGAAERRVYRLLERVKGKLERLTADGPVA